MACLERGVVPKENRGNILFAHLGPADLPSFCTGIGPKIKNLFSNYFSRQKGMEMLRFSWLILKDVKR